jgi:hypothetical protein
MIDHVDAVVPIPRARPRTHLVQAASSSRSRNEHRCIRRCRLLRARTALLESARRGLFLLNDEPAEYDRRVAPACSVLDPSIVGAPIRRGLSTRPARTQEPDACAPGRGGGAGGMEERAPPDTNLPGGLEMTWPVLLSLKQSCVDLLIVMCQPQASHSRDASVCSTIEIKRGTAADQFAGCPSWRVDWADGQRQLPPTRFVSGKIEGRRNQRPTVSARALWSSSGKSRATLRKFVDAMGETVEIPT